MNYTFSWGSFLIGLLVLAAGICLTVWYRPIADNLGHGVSSYERYRLYGLVGVVAGFIVMLNLHALFFVWFFSNFFGTPK